MGLSYFASRLSDNIARTPEGFLICQDAVLARTGWQSYEVRELPADALEKLGVDASDPYALVPIYRSPEEVFAKETIASFEGKSLCDGHPPADQFVDASNVTQFEFGHVQNVRRGTEALESGDWPLIGDIIIKREPLISKVESGMDRELSCGYDYSLARDGERIVQVEILGNHVAVVRRGRAGAEARINDAAPVAQASVAGTGSTGEQQTHKEIAVADKPTLKERLKLIFGLGLKAYATDASPEDLAEAAEAVNKHGKDSEEKPEEKPTEKPADKPAEKPAKDGNGFKWGDDKTNDTRSADEQEHRTRMHAALDRLLDGGGVSPEADAVLPVEEGQGQAQGGVHAEDADVEELRNLLSEFFAEEAAEPEHAQDADGGAEHGQPGRARDEFVEPATAGQSPVIVDGSLEALRRLRPFVARSKDAELRRTFNEMLAAHSRSSRPARPGTGYAGFAGASATRAVDSQQYGEESTPPAHKRLQEAYDAQRTGKKGAA